MYYNELSSRVRFHKPDEKGVQNMCKIVEEYGDERAAEALKIGIEKGIEQGMQKQAVATAKKLLKDKKYTVEEISATGFVYENRSAAYGNDEWEYDQMLCYNNVWASLVGQIILLPKIFFDIKAGGGITEILVKTDYVRDREPAAQAFTYPVLNAGASFEIVPIKKLVFEIGADYNIILSTKINFSYLMPYLEVGVRF